MKRFHCALFITLLACQLSACGGLGRVFESPPPTLADLEPVALAVEEGTLPQVGLAELAEIYRDVLSHQQDPKTRVKILHRLADIEMRSGEASMVTAEDERILFAQAIEAYEGLLRDNPEYEARDRILYQLSKAYDLSGQSDKSLQVLERLSSSAPDSTHLPEANFRRAERYFVEAAYAEAEATYAQVIAYGDSTPYYTRALYMQGWSRFKQDRYYESIAAFSTSLDQILLPDNRVEDLPRGERELVQDSLRVLAIVFGNLEGTKTIAKAYDEAGVRPYQHLFYEALGTLYLSQERYRDSAQTYQTFNALYPGSTRAHEFQLRVIEAYDAGGFPELILEAKQDYVQVFGVSGDYWANSEADAQLAMGVKLRAYIEELANHYHATAQAAAKRQSNSPVAIEQYALAARYYQLFLDSFAQDEAVPKMAFLLGESQFEARNYPAAISAYEWMAYTHKNDERAADAAYTAILAHEKLLESSRSESPEEGGSSSSSLHTPLIDAQLRFASNFQSDNRATTVLGDAATRLFALQDYSGAIAAATALVSWEPLASAALRVPAWLVLGNSQFELGEYATAEQAYTDSLAIMPVSDSRYGGTKERLAATIYKQAEGQVAAGDDLLAAQQFDRVLATAPNSKIRLNAQYDAALAYMRAGELARANTLLIDFRQRYPQHALSADIGSTLIANYEKQEQWHAAARELDALHGVQEDGELKRQSLIVAAQYYDKIGDSETAIARYRSYAHEWPQPFAQRIEAMNRLSELYADAGEPKKRYFWLEKLETTHRNAGANSTQRSGFLAAQACTIFADDNYQAYRKLRLTSPLKRSLRAKRAAMEKTLTHYSRCSEYGIEQFTTLSNYRIAHVYQLLSAELMESERPAAMDALALEQYELLLEEQAFPFEEKAIAIHETNVQRCWEGVYDDSIQASFVALQKLLPARYKQTRVNPDRRRQPGRLPERQQARKSQCTGNRTAPGGRV